MSVHHYSERKRRAGWKKAGKPGQAGIDYIYRFTKNDLFALIPTGSCRAVGYYDLLRIPVFGARLQNAAARLFGLLALRLGLGHMLVTDYRNQKLKQNSNPQTRPNTPKATAAFSFPEK